MHTYELTRLNQTNLEKRYSPIPIKSILNYSINVNLTIHVL